MSDGSDIDAINALLRAATDRDQFGGPDEAWGAIDGGGAGAG